MMDPMCKPCEKDGVLRKALRIVPKVGPVCHDHFTQWQRGQIPSAEPAPKPALADITTIATKLHADGLGQEEVKSALVNLGYGALSVVSAVKGLFTQPAAPAKQEEKMPKPRTDVDWDQLRKEYQAGTSAADLAEKFGVHVSSVYMHVKGAAKKPRPTLTELARGNGNSETPKKPGRPAPAAHTRGGYDQVISDLRAKAQKLNDIADQLEGM